MKIRVESRNLRTLPKSLFFSKESPSSPNLDAMKTAAFARCTTQKEAQKNLYDDHYSNYPTGCPRYIELSVEERFEVAKEVKLCLSCHDPKYTWKFKDSVHLKDCVVKKGKKAKSIAAEMKAAIYTSGFVRDTKIKMKPLLNLSFTR